MKIIVLFNLKSDADPEAYENWAKTIDIPGVNALVSVNRFTVHKSSGQFGSDAAPSYDYVEIIDISTLDGFVDEVSTEDFQKVAAAFGDYADNPEFIMTEEL